MFLKTAGFKKLIKEAYKGAGLRIGRTQDGLYLAGSYWAMQIMGGQLPKEKLAAIIELIGELPEMGEAFTADGNGQQYELPWSETFNVIKNAEKCMFNMNVTKVVVMSGRDNPWRVLQHQHTGAIRMISERFIQMIDDKEVDERNGHTKAEGPLSGKMQGVFWKNNVMALYVMPRMEDDVEGLIRFLEGIDINGVMTSGDDVPEE